MEVILTKWPTEADWREAYRRALQKSRKNKIIISYFIIYFTTRCFCITRNVNISNTILFQKSYGSFNYNFTFDF